MPKTTKEIISELYVVGRGNIDSDAFYDKKMQEVWFSSLEVKNAIETAFKEYRKRIYPGQLIYDSGVSRFIASLKKELELR